MAGNYPFHGKLHRSTHHTTPTPGVLESGTDPIAGPSSKFQGIFYTQNEASSYEWYSSYTTLKANSAYWVSVYTTVYANSARWESVYTSSNQTSASWDSVYTTVRLLSDAWEESFIISPLQIASAGWQSNYITTNANSASWSNAYTNLVTNSSFYLSGGAANLISFDPITTTTYFSGRLTPLTLTAPTVQEALSALNDRINSIYLLLQGLTANQSTILVGITGSS
jgi:hypothetical protein